MVERDDDGSLEATLEKELVRARIERELFRREMPVKLGRFEVLRCIGRGSLGVVYEARDKDHGGHVALKLLRRVDGQTIAQFKHEFRVLSGITHPNLVALHELVCEREHWFASMELIDGVTFDRWLWPDPAAGLDLPRLRHALAQLVAAVTAIHRAGKLHRDLKPSNVLVTAAGRVVVLDFGLVSARGVVAPPAQLVGTPAYMAPEQAAREPAREASDWYSVGVMLFEALTHRLPFDGPTRDVLRDKLRRPAPRVRELAPDVPVELDLLCQGLLENDPQQRSGASAIETWLGSARLPERRFSELAHEVAPALLIGRDTELKLLASELQRKPSRGTRVVWLQAAPGLGKTALLEVFATRAASRALVLRGRCHEGESIPFKIFDAIADALSEALEVPTVAADVQVTPEDAGALVQMFPALDQVTPIARAAVGGGEIDVTEHAFAALKRLLTGLARAQPLAFVIDDLQWADDGSAQRFREVFGSPGAPACLFVGAFRGDDARSCSFERNTAIADAARIDLEPLPLSAASELARQLLRAQGLPATPELSRKLARDTGGVPYLLTELVEHTKRPRRSSASSRSSTGAVALGAALRARIDALPDRARRLLSVVCVVPEPIPLRIALAAAGLPADEHTALAHIYSGHLARSQGGRPIDTLEPYHERVRRAVLQGLAAANRVAIEAEVERLLEAQAQPPT